MPITTRLTKGKESFIAAIAMEIIIQLIGAFICMAFLQIINLTKKGEKARNKIEPIANNTQLETPSFTNEQYQQLLALLNDGNAHPKANIAGQLVPLCLSSHTRNTYSNKWVIDSGATDHITSFRLITQSKSTPIFFCLTT